MLMKYFSVGHCSMDPSRKKTSWYLVFAFMWYPLLLYRRSMYPCV